MDTRMALRALVRLTVTAALAAVPAEAAPPANVAEWAEAHDHLAVHGPGVDAAGRVLTYGNLELTLGAGRLVPVRAGGDVVGLFFAGTGRFRYVSMDAVEAPVYRRNAAKVSRYEVAADGSITDSLEEALILSSSAAALGAGDRWPEGPAHQETARRLAAHVERRRLDYVPQYRQVLTEARFDPPAQPLVLAELKAGRHDVFYLRDTLRDHSERLAVLRKVGARYDALLKERRFADDLSRQPFGRPRLQRPPVPYVLRHLDVSVVNPKGASAEVVAREKIEAASRRRTLAFDLASHIPGGRFPPYRLVTVTGAGGAPLSYTHHGNELLVELPEPLGPGQVAELTFTMAGDVLERPDGDNAWLLLRNWYPSPRLRAMSAFTYHAVVKAADGFIPFSSGATIRRWKEGGLTCAEFRDTRPMEFAEVLAGRYTTHTEARGALTVRVSSYAFAKGDAARQIAGLVHAFVGFYEPLLGPFPWPEIDVVEIPTYGFGHAPAGMIFITREAFTPLSDPVAMEFVKGINARLAHEVAHAWFGHVAKDSYPEDQWLSESTADYFAAIAMEQLKDKKEFGSAIDEWKEHSRRSPDLPVYLANSLTGDDAFRVRQRLLYAKGPLMLDALRRELGDNTFFTIHKSLMRSFPMKTVTTRDFIGLTGFVAKRDLQPWFDRYLFGPEMPPPRK
jgi:hypothetical protein